MLILSALIYLSLPFYAQRLHENTANEILAAAKPLQTQIAKRLLSSGPVDLEQDTLPQPNIDLVTYYLTTQTGKIVLFNEQLGSLMVLTPKIRDKDVRWDCFGRPLRYMPTSCRYQ